MSGINFNEPILLELFALDIQNVNESLTAPQDYSRYVRVASRTITHQNNQKPIAASDTFSFLSGAAPTFNIIANDYDPDGQGLEVVFSTYPQHGIIQSVSATGVKYTPHAGYPEAFSDRFTYRVFDGEFYSNGTTVDLNFAALTAVADNAYVNWHEPTVAARGISAASMTGNRAVNINLMDNDLSHSTAGLQMKLASAPQSGSINANVGDIIPSNNGLITYTLTSAVLGGSDCFTYYLVAPDGKESNRVPACVSNLPIPADDSYARPENAASYLDVTLNDDFGPHHANDIEIKITRTPNHGSVSTTSSGGHPQIVYTPAAGIYGNISFEYELSLRKEPHLAAVRAATVSLSLAPAITALEGFNVVKSTNDSYTVSWLAATNVNTTYEVEHLYHHVTG